MVSYATPWRGQSFAAGAWGGARQRHAPLREPAPVQCRPQGQTGSFTMLVAPGYASVPSPPPIQIRALKSQHSLCRPERMPWLPVPTRLRQEPPPQLSKGLLDIFPYYYLDIKDLGSVLQFACLITTQLCRTDFVCFAFFQNRKRNYFILETIIIQFLCSVCVAEFDR